MALQICAKCSTAYAPAAVCPHCGYDQWHADYDNEAVEGQVQEALGGEPLSPHAEVPEPVADAEPAAEPVPVADQRAAGVPVGETVTLAEQAAGAPAPEPPSPPVKAKPAPVSTPEPNSPASSAPGDEVEP